MQNEKVAVDLPIKKDYKLAIEEEDRDAVNATAKELKVITQNKLAQTWDQRKQEAAVERGSRQSWTGKKHGKYAVSTINWVKSEMEKRKG